MGGVGEHFYGLDFAGNIARRGKICRTQAKGAGLQEA